ncbi:MAG: outer membrane porin, OprD family [Magnetococcales bacterium]|nr:outer membrane porin, OprD family [Magnetococcales bacterium]
MSLCVGMAVATVAPCAGASDEHPFFSQSKIGMVTRLATFHRFSPLFNQEGAGLGGWLYANSGEIAETLSFGGTLYFVQPIHAPHDRPFNYILKDPGQDEVWVLGEAYSRLRFGKHTLTLGRQALNFGWPMENVFRFYNKLDQSMIGRRDVRGMHPITYEAVVAQGKFQSDRLRYYLGHATAMKQINDDRFRNFYQGAYQTTVFPESAKVGDSDGMSFAGVIWKPDDNLMLTFSHHWVENMLDMGYADIDRVFRLSENRYVRLGAQYMRQSSNGGSLVSNGRDFATDYGGLYGETRLMPWLIHYAMAGVTADDDEIRAPYSIGPSYLVQRVGENSKAGERTWIVGSAIDFAPLGIGGLVADLNYGRRSNRHQGGFTQRPLPNWDELAADLIYTVPQKSGLLKNLRVRARYAKVWETGEEWSRSLVGTVNRTINDLRYDLTWDIPFN